MYIQAISAPKFRECPYVPLVSTMFWLLGLKELSHHHDVVKWNIFGVTGPLCGEFTGRRWFPLTQASGAELWCFRCSVPEHTIK